MRSITKFLKLFIFVAGRGTWSHASAMVVEVLNLGEPNFFADPTVTVASPGGLSAIFREDPPFVIVILSNDPGLGEPALIFPAANRSLTFNYDFNEPLGNDETFSAHLIDAMTGEFIPGFDFLVDATEIGSHTFDLSTLANNVVGLQFQLNSERPGDAAATSTLEIAAVRVVTADATAPEPPTGVLILAGLIAWWARNGHLGSLPGKRRRSAA